MGDIRQYFKAPALDTTNMGAPDFLSCPFCTFRSPDFQKLQCHVQSSHSDQIETPKQSSNDQSDLSDAELAQLLAFEEAGIPAELAFEDFKKRSLSERATENSREDDDLWIDCFCGERILLQEIDIHSNMHQLEIQDPNDIEDGETIESMGPGGPLSSSSQSRPQNTLASKTPTHFNQGHARRLGKSELGPYAYEDRMPKWLHSMLSNNVGTRPEEVIMGDRAFRYSALPNETHLLIPKLQLLSRADSRVIKSVFCSPVVNHVSKLFKEGGFCGYRNIQMLISYLRGCLDSKISETFRGRLPTIFELQDGIEAAWDSGIQAHARQETGGIRNTRKYIGTAEATAFFMSKQVSCRTEAFANTDELAACDAMLESLKRYFTNGQESSPPAPVYLQYKGHSLTVVGFEELVAGDSFGESTEINLIIFDPMFRIPPSLKKMSVKSSKPEAKLNFLRPFRFPRQRFKRFNQFELLFLES